MRRGRGKNGRKWTGDGEKERRGQRGKCGKLESGVKGGGRRGNREVKGLSK